MREGFFWNSQGPSSKRIPAKMTPGVPFRYVRHDKEERAR